MATSNLTIVEIGLTFTEVVMCRMRNSRFRHDVSGDWTHLNLLSTNMSLGLSAWRTNNPTLRRRVPRDGMRVFPEGHPEETAPGPVCPGVTWMMQLQTEFVSIDLLTVLSVQEKFGYRLEIQECILGVQAAQL